VKIALFGHFDSYLVERLAAHDVRVLAVPDRPAIERILADVEGLVMRSVFHLERDDATRARHLKWILRAGSGLENIPSTFAERGVEVTAVPLNARAVAELALAMAWALARRLPAGHDGVRIGRWRKDELVGFELRGKTLGILGFGRIGRELARLAHGLDLDVVVWDRSPTKPEKVQAASVASVQFGDFVQVLRTSDIVVAALPGGESTRHLLTPSALAELRPGAVFVNVGRGSLVSLDDLHALVVAGRLSGVGLDVYPTEPPPYHPLFDLEGVLCSPHLGAQTRETRLEIARFVVDWIAGFERRRDGDAHDRPAVAPALTARRS
jgi:D-3-phosphoglycerate dehydrogenase / 2-oxoglutarate reductase